MEQNFSVEIDDGKWLTRTCQSVGLVLLTCLQAYDGLYIGEPKVCQLGQQGGFLLWVSWTLCPQSSLCLWIIFEDHEKAWELFRTQSHVLGVTSKLLDPMEAPYPTRQQRGFRGKTVWKWQHWQWRAPCLNLVSLLKMFPRLPWGCSKCFFFFSLGLGVKRNRWEKWRNSSPVT